MLSDQTFDPSKFKKIKKAEKEHFWFVARRKWIFDRIRQFCVPPADFLEVGCGTGNVSSFLAKAGYVVTGCELYEEAIKIAWQGFKIMKGDANSLPFENQSFDIVGLFDVIEHLDDPVIALKEALRVLKPGGIVSVTVPARKELWSYYDEISLHRRRYTKESLSCILQEAGFSVLKINYMFMALYLPMKYLRGNQKHGSADQFNINPLVNVLLKRLFEMERHISGFLPLPIGTSLIGVARKDIRD
ncbi:putative S-adenosylmethionine-dependent methyltransferase/MSMEI_2290 [bacterium BMS3Abin07]|nr:putative S-adenosylmethionine-dependent methyltransferase/MSMEI_2290 [bacterium BMS3Abin07]HDO22778.1 SAM-dependent methyltransferase [Nitrospirota bacterium]HDZ88825.1 SAM-dependent methyltransferase [Nitrospirota bacterium]